MPSRGTRSGLAGGDLTGQAAVRAHLHDEVVPALSAAMLRLHLLLETHDDLGDLGATALQDLERAAAGLQQAMSDLSPATGESVGAVRAS